ncbi:unnamed protein product [Prunus armeniaca]|uniref:Uncharacterized protein n=1 Tax=Prunus armeniaca TaxID=36596 RepID=A0A6J5TY84_PRUAR|nr:unnamed protein product [Prunus armeniaca]
MLPTTAATPSALPSATMVARIPSAPLLWLFWSSTRFSQVSFSDKFLGAAPGSFLTKVGREKKRQVVKELDQRFQQQFFKTLAAAAANNFPKGLMVMVLKSDEWVRDRGRQKGTWKHHFIFI